MCGHLFLYPVPDWKRENTVSRSMESHSLYFCTITLENNTYAMDSLEVLSSLHGIDGHSVLLKIIEFIR